MGAGEIPQSTSLFRLAVTRQLGGTLCTHPERRSLVRHASGGLRKRLGRSDAIPKPPDRDGRILAPFGRNVGWTCRAA